MSGDELLDEKTTTTSQIQLQTAIVIGFCIAATYFLADQILYQIIQDLLITLKISPATVFWSTNILLATIELITFFNLYRFLKNVSWSESEKAKSFLKNCFILLMITFMIDVLFLNFWDRLFSDNFFFDLSIYEETLRESNMYRVLPIVFQMFCVGVFIKSFIKTASPK